MTKIVVVDTGPLIALSLIDLLPVLPKLFTVVCAPEAVVAEATVDTAKPGAQVILQALEQGLVVRKTVNLSGRLQALSELLDLGEIEVLALAEQLNATALIDERRGRTVAMKLGIPLTGTAAVLIKAKQAGEVVLVKPLVKPRLEKLLRHGYRLSPSLMREVITHCGE